MDRASEPEGSVLPHYEPETGSVRFRVHACGATIAAFVTRDWLRLRFGPSVPEGPRLVDAYLAHAGEIDLEVARRYSRGRLEPVWLASAFAPDDA